VPSVTHHAQRKAFFKWVFVRGCSLWWVGHVASGNESKLDSRLLLNYYITRHLSEFYPLSRNWKLWPGWQLNPLFYQCHVDPKEWFVITFVHLSDKLLAITSHKFCLNSFVSHCHWFYPFSKNLPSISTVMRYTSYPFVKSWSFAAKLNNQHPQRSLVWPFSSIAQATVIYSEGRRFNHYLCQSFALNLCAWVHFHNQGFNTQIDVGTHGTVLYSLID